MEHQLEAESEAPLLLVIDQLEELLLEGEGDRAAEAERFLSWLGPPMAKPRCLEDHRGGCPRGCN